MARKNALEVVRAIPAAYEDVEEAVRSVADSIELQCIRLGLGQKRCIVAHDNIHPLLVKLLLYSL